MDSMNQTFETVQTAWHFETLNEDARDILREAQAVLDQSDGAVNEVVRRVLSHVARRLPAHSLEIAVDEGDGTHVLHRVRAGEVEAPIVLHACDPKGRPVDLRGSWRTLDFNGAVPDAAIAAIESAEQASGWLIDREIDGGLLRLCPEFPDERVLARVLDALIAVRGMLIDQIEGLWRVTDIDGLSQVSVRVADGRAHVEPVHLRTTEGEDQSADTLLRWTYENAERVPPREPSLGSSEGEPVVARLAA
jgi:hypothetical protein